MANFRLFALLVCIDEYKAELIPNLKGCAADGHRFRQYLVDSLRVPPDHIVMLTDSGATREAILQTFRDHFIHNDRILHSDTMLFFFAGHGGRVIAPRQWTTNNGLVETICPYDESVGATTRPEVFGIPARTFWALTLELASVKGSNIMMILDCCHSSNGIGGRIARGHDNRAVIPKSLDEWLWSPYAARHDKTSIPSRFIYRNMSSHVLLTACSQDQMAFELDCDDGLRGGVFTHNLINTLHQVSPVQTTYAGLLNLLPPLPDQDPQCSGDNTICLLFTVTPQLDMLFFTVRKSNSVGFEVNAGQTEGVTENTEFRLYQEANVRSALLGIFAAKSVNPTSCKIISKSPQSPVSMPHISYALVTQWEHPDARLAIFVDLEASSMTLRKAFSSIQMADAAPFGVTRVSSQSDADIILYDAKGLLHITRTDRLISVYANPHIGANIELNPDRILRVLRSAAHFKFFSRRAENVSPPHSAVRVEIYQLEESDDGQYVPIGNNLVRDGEARIFLSDEPYGITLHNDSEHNLFPSLLYFNPSDYSIRPWYVPPSSALLAPLRSKSELLVAHGNEDGHVIKFTLKPSEHSDTGFLILYLSTQYRDMTYISQDGAFGTPSPVLLAERAAHVTSDNGEHWSAALTIITVVRGDPLMVPAAVDAPPISHSPTYAVFCSVLGVILVALFCFLLAHRPFFTQ